jgi:hypothetical protein
MTWRRCGDEVNVKEPDMTEPFAPNCRWRSLVAALAGPGTAIRIDSVLTGLASQLADPTSERRERIQYPKDSSSAPPCIHYPRKIIRSWDCNTGIASNDFGIISGAAIFSIIS